MTNRIEFFIPLEPKGQARARHMVAANGRAITYKSGKQRLEENKLAAYMIQAAEGRRLSGPLRLQLVARIPIPGSWPKKRKAAALAGEIWPEKKPDLSNIIKNIEDVAQGLLFDDDKSICQILCSKLFAEHAGYWITFDEIRETVAILDYRRP